MNRRKFLQSAIASIIARTTNISVEEIEEAIELELAQEPQKVQTNADHNLGYSFTKDGITWTLLHSSYKPGDLLEEEYILTGFNNRIVQGDRDYISECVGKAIDEYSASVTSNMADITAGTAFREYKKVQESHWVTTLVYL